MSIIEVRLFELRMKGERQGEIDAEEILNRRAVAQARAQARCLYLRRLGHQLSEWMTQRLSTRVGHSNARTN